MTNEIFKLLSNQKLRDTVVKRINEVYDYAGTLYYNPPEDMEDIPEEDLWHEAWWRAEIHGEINKIDEAFEKYVFNKMQKPYCIEPKEIVDEFFALACPGGIGCPEFECTYFDDLYMYFINNIHFNILSQKCSVPFPFCELRCEENEVSDDLLRGIAVGLGGKDEVSKFLLNEVQRNKDIDNILWQHNNFMVSLSETTFVGTQAHTRKKQLNATVSGKMSNKVFNKMETIVPKVLRTAVKSLSLLNEVVDEDDFINANRIVFEQYLNAYFIEPTRKDTFEKRIHNAVHLLIESDLQMNNAIAISLSIAAIEALIGEKGESINEKLSTHVATLLEPDLEFRAKAKKFVKKLYNQRSRVLHGSELKSEDLCKKQARHLAAGVLSSILLRRDLKKRFGEKAETPQDLLVDLSNSQYKGGLPDGILENNVRRYWQNGN